MVRRPAPCQKQKNGAGDCCLGTRKGGAGETAKRERDYELQRQATADMVVSLASSVAAETVMATMASLALPPPPPPQLQGTLSQAGRSETVTVDKECLARVAMCLDRATKATEKAMRISLQASNAFKEEMDRLTQVKKEVRLILGGQSSSSAGPSRSRCP